MNSESNPGIPPPIISARRINWRPIGLTLLAAILLAVTSCFGAITSGGKTLSVVFSVLFIGAVLMFVGGLVWGLVVRIRASR
jgi:hypothetical protein